MNEYPKAAQEPADVRILVCYHKPYPLPDHPMYLPIQVGKANASVDLGILGDNECSGEACDHISEKNNIYCEMTGMYWAWKNIRKIYPDLQYIGLCHYRRYFNTENHQAYITIEHFLKKMRACFAVITGYGRAMEMIGRSFTVHELNTARFRKSNEKLLGLIRTHDLVAVKPYIFLNVNVKTYMSNIGIRYIDLMEEIVSEKYPEYQDALRRILKGSRLYPGNMVVMKTELFDTYCSFVFGVLDSHLEELKKRNICTDPEHEGIFARISGFLSEMLTSAFIEKHRKEIRSCFVNRFHVEE